MIKKTILLILTVVLLVVFPASVFADIEVKIDGKEYEFDPAPFIKDGRAMVPMRSFFESLEANVSWEEDTETAIGNRDDTEIRIPVGSKTPTVNGQTRNIDVAAKIIEGRTFIPLRFVGESLGDEVKWNKKTRVINVSRVEDPKEEKHALNIEKINQGSVVFNGESLLKAEKRLVEPGSEVKLKACPAPAWEFSHWEGNISGSKVEESIVVDKDMDITAVFERADNNAFDIYTSIDSYTIGPKTEIDDRSVLHRYHFHIYLDSLAGDVKILSVQRKGYAYDNYIVLDDLGDPWEDLDYGYNDKFGKGFGSYLPREMEDGGFTDIYVVAETVEGETIEGGARVFIDPDKAPKPARPEDPEIDEKYDTEILQHDADFELEVEEEIHWVPAVSLGTHEFTASELKEMKGRPNELQKNINTLYDALHYLDVSGYKTYGGNVRIEGDGGHWEHYEPAENSIETNSGNCAATANTIVYLLQNNYDEVGFVMWWYPLGRGGHFMNYIKQDGFYYIFDAGAYKDRITAAVESGHIQHYSQSDSGTNIHKVDANHLEDYVSYYRSQGRSDIVFFGLIEQEDDLFPIDNRSKEQQIRVVPYGNLDKIVEIYNDADAPVKLEEVEPPKRKPDESKYHPSEYYEGDRFVR